MYLCGVEQRPTEQFKCLSSMPVLKQKEFPILPEEFLTALGRKYFLGENVVN